MIDTSSTTTETWARRVQAWRTNGKRAEEFSRHEATRRARCGGVVRTVTAVPAPALASPFAAIMIDVTLTGVRVASAQETLTMVLDLVRTGAAQ